MSIGDVIKCNYNVFWFVVDPVLAYFYWYYSIYLCHARNNDKHKGEKRDKTWLGNHYTERPRQVLKGNHHGFNITAGFHYHHVGRQNKRKFAHIVCIKIEVNSQRRKILLLPSTNMTDLTSHAILQ